MKILRVLKSHLVMGYFIFVVFLFLIGEAGAATYYVDKANLGGTCSDSNNGTATATPWCTIAKATATVVAGDTVNIRAATYYKSLALTTSGTAGNYITFQAYTGETPILDGTGLGSVIMVNLPNVGYVKIIGLTITNYDGSGIRASLSGTGKNLSHIEIRNNTISNQTYTGSYGHTILVAAWPWSSNNSYTDIIIDGNTIHDVDTGIDTAHNEVLTVAGTITRFQITNNTIYNAPYIGIDVIGRNYDSYEQYPNNGIISGNTLYGIGEAAKNRCIYIDGAKNITIENNIVYNSTGHGISVNAEQAGFTTANIIVRRNKIWNVTRNISFGSTDSGLANNTRVVHNTTVITASGLTANYGIFCGSGNIAKNNISYISSTVLFHIYMNYPTCYGYNYIFDYNNYYPSNKQLKYQGSTYTPLLAWQQIGQDTHSISQDPLFMNLGGDFRLQSNSPCIDHGGFLTTTSSSGTGTTLVVQDARYFTDGYGVVQGDLIQVGSNAPVRVTSVNYNTNTITVDKSISWNKGDGVSYPYSGSAPDMGAYEYGGTSPLPIIVPPPTPPSPGAPTLNP